MSTHRTIIHGIGWSMYDDFDDKVHLSLDYDTEPITSLKFLEALFPMPKREFVILWGILQGIIGIDLNDDKEMRDMLLGEENGSY
jgi:hypothetical protein